MGSESRDEPEWPLQGSTSMEQSSSFMEHEHCLSCDLDSGEVLASQRRHGGFWKQNGGIDLATSRGLATRGVDVLGTFCPQAGG